MGLDISHYKPVLPGVEFSEFFEVRELAGIPGYLEQNQNFIALYEFPDETPVPVIYFEDVGYQRKGMTAEFYDHFGNDALRADLESVLKAFTFIEGHDKKHTRELKVNFQQNFINSFEPGKSLFFAGW